MEIAFVWLASIAGTALIAYTHRLPMLQWVALGMLLGPAATIAAAIKGTGDNNR